MSGSVLLDIYDRLLKRFGPQHWWPGQTTFEIIIGAILTQNTNWTNVEKAIARLKKARVLNPAALFKTDAAELAELIRPAGYYNIKAARIKHFLDWLYKNHQGQLDRLNNLPADTLRQQLLSVKGIGPETADSICLYAFEKPVFVVDAYTARILARHRLIAPDDGYEQIRLAFESSLPRDVQMYNEYHALLVRLGKEFCRPNPRCSGCPLEDLPHETAPPPW